MIGDERLRWIGVGFVAGVAAVFAGRLLAVARGRAPARVLYQDAIQDVAFLCLGVALVFPRGTTGRLAFMASAAVCLAATLWRRFLGERGAKRGNGRGDEGAA